MELRYLEVEKQVYCIVYFNNKKFPAVQNVMPTHIAIHVIIKMLIFKIILKSSSEDHFVYTVIVKLVSRKNTMKKNYKRVTENGLAIFEHKGLEVKLYE